MEMQINRSMSSNFPDARMTHRGESLRWNGKLFKDTNVMKDELDELHVFDQINGFWAHQPEATQDKIFDVYRRIKELFRPGDIPDQRQLTKQLYVLVAELYQYHDLTAIRRWVDFYAENIFIPHNIPEYFNPSGDKTMTREKTYIKEDYRWLITMSVALRAMYPIWGDFVETINAETGTQFKEYYAFLLLAQSSIYHSEPMERLRTYVSNTIPAGELNDSAILGGLSSEDFPVWMLALSVVRRLTIGDISGINSNLITNVHTYITNKNKNVEKTGFVGIVKPKLFEGASQDGDNNLSRLEGYKVKQDIPAGDVAILAFSVHNVHGNARRLCPGIDPKLVDMSLKSTKALMNVQLKDPQVTLIRWVMKPVITPRGIMQLGKKEMLEAMAVTQAVLWHTGYKELAALVSARAQPNDEEMQLREAPIKTRIPRELQDQLEVLFPYARRQSGRSRDPLAKKQNSGALAIETMAAQFREHEWSLTLPGDWVAEMTGSKSDTWYSVPHDLRVKLAQLVIAISSRTFVNKESS